jgi:hypothetical protein
MRPRIYTYKVTFEEIPDWYWGAHKEKKYGEPYLGSPKTHAWKWEFYTPHLQICEIFPYTDEGWIEAQDVEKRCIRPDLNNPLCLNEHVGGFISLEANRRGAEKTHAIIHKEKDALGRSVHGVKNAEKTNKGKDDLGRSVNAVKGGIAAHKDKDELGRSVTAMKAHKDKDDLGRSVNAMRTNNQVWESTVDGFRSNSGAVARHNKARGWDPNARVKVK